MYTRNYRVVHCRSGSSGGVNKQQTLRSRSGYMQRSSKRGVTSRYACMLVSITGLSLDLNNSWY